MRHPGDQCIEFSNFLSCQGVYTITLRTDSCLCNACHRDCLRSSGKPRWLGLSKHIICKHCFVCCNGPTSCACENILEWGPEQHFKNDEFKKVAEYLQWDISISLGQEQNICKSHYVNMHQAITNRTCKMCNSNSSSQWMLGRELLEGLGSCANTESIGVGVCDWVCECCFNSMVYPRGGGKRQSKYVLARNEALDHAVKVLDLDGACTIRSIMDVYQTLVLEKYGEAISDSEHENFKKILKTKLSMCGYSSYYPCPKLGSMFYKSSVISGEGLKLVYKLLNKTYAGDKQSPDNTEYIRS